MSELKTPYLDKEIDFLKAFTVLNTESKEELQEYQQIKAALKRLEDLEGAARPILAVWEAGDGTERLSELFLNLKEILEK